MKLLSKIILLTVVVFVSSVFTLCGWTSLYFPTNLKYPFLKMRKNTTNFIRNEANLAKGNVTTNQATRTCQRKNNIGFLKMHKCGSTTLQNILMRYGVRYDLDFVLPRSGHHLSYAYFTKEFIKYFPVHEYNILCHHTRFSKEEFDSVLPTNSTYVTIIRDPASMYESIYTYMKLNSIFGVPLATFLNNPNHYYQASKRIGYAKDALLYDLGLEIELEKDANAIDNKIKSVARDFDLVMLMEYFPESLILLKEMMCWDFQDIAYFKINSRSRSSVMAVTDKSAEKIRQWNVGDTKLYSYFNRTFWEKVRAYGEERMRKEVTKLEKMNQMLKDRCVDRKVINDNKVWHPAGVSIESLQLKASVANDTDCQLMAKTEVPFTDYVRKRQIAKYFGPIVRGVKNSSTLQNYVRQRQLAT